MSPLFFCPNWRRTTFSVKIKIMKTKNDGLKFAMKLISLRRRSVFEVTERLNEKGLKENAIEEILEELKKYKYLDDRQFAESYINDRMNFNPRGKFLIKQELREKGVAENIIEEKTEELISEKKEIESARKLAEKKLRVISGKNDKNKTNRKIISYLQSKGYSFEIISQAVKNEIE